MQFRSVLLFCLAVISLPAAAQKMDCRDNLARSEKWWMQGKYKESDHELGEAMKACPNNAEIYWRKAVGLEPQHIEYLKELGVSLICYSYRKKSPAAMEEGKKYLTRLQDLPNVKYSDAGDKLHARMLLRHPELACSYSYYDPETLKETEFEKSREK